jgi:hypothetical protein
VSISLAIDPLLLLLKKLALNVRLQSLPQVLSVQPVVEYENLK